MNRRYFLLSAAAFAGGCMTKTPQPTTANAVVRPPMVDQAWRYAKRDAVSGELLGNESCRVASIGETIEIEVHFEPPAAASSNHWDPLAFTRRSPRGAVGRPLPSEVQKPWGMVIVDPHWQELQQFADPVPLWPTRLQSGWSDHIHTTYLTATAQAPLSWDLSMLAHRWETISVPAGRFNTLRYSNLIDFSSSDVFRRSSQRRETLWFAPQIGRWVARESEGSYYRAESVDDQRLFENAYRSELLSWS